MRRFLWGLAFLSLLAPMMAAAATKPTDPDPARMKEIAGWLPASPRGMGATIADRAAWEKVATETDARYWIRNAEKALATPIPELPDELYLDFTRNGNRTRYQHVLGQRRGRLRYLLVAECLENQGRFLKAIEAEIKATAMDKSWLMPAHDSSLCNFNGTQFTIDLASSALSWELATTDYWLGDKLSDTTRKLIRSEVKRRTFDPYEQSVRTGKPRLWWITGSNNWNAVCEAGVVGAALALIDSPEQRAFYVAAAEANVKHFLRGFTPDGYCSEGVGYWNYGFGHYALLAETVCQATGGRLDMMAWDNVVEGSNVEQIARFGLRMEITPGVYPAFADCSTRSKPDSVLQAYLARRFGWVEDGAADPQAVAWKRSRSLVSLPVFGFPTSADRVAVAQGPGGSLPLRDWFPDAGILICRSTADAKTPFGVAMKGGHNAEHHNHNDVGSYLFVIGKNVPLIDPGGEVYTRRTFSAQRYESDVLNSFGHPVPRVAGELQPKGRAAAAKVLKTEFTDATDTFVLDMKAAYDVKPLKQLKRTFVFSRQATGSLTVTDEVEFDSPQQFGTALITFEPWKKLADDRLQVGEGEGAVEVRIIADGGKVQLNDDRLTADMHVKGTPVRLGIDFAEPVKCATITVVIKELGAGD